MEDQMLCEMKVEYYPTVKPKERQALHRSSEVYQYIKKIFQPGQINYRETFFVLNLDNRNRVISHMRVSEGGTTGTVVDKKIVFQCALLANAHSIILTHNHPSGTTTPSEADKLITRQIIDAGKFLDIKVLDHLIVTEDSYLSFADDGILTF
jgi:DNA repair protein RadC